jgi:2,4-dienoyl-CoA reductase-like NADH-dependent reductase (Old Yellow Enzyme family)
LYDFRIEASRPGKRVSNSDARTRLERSTPFRTLKISLCAREYIGPDRIGPKLKAAFGGVYVVNEKFTFETAEKTVEAGEADAVAFGKRFIANPDLPRRFALRAPLNEPRSAEFYTGGANGYTDYPSLPPGDQSPDLNSSQARVNARVSSGL